METITPDQASQTKIFKKSTLFFLGIVVLAVGWFLYFKSTDVEVSQTDVVDGLIVENKDVQQPQNNTTREESNESDSSAVQPSSLVPKTTVSENESRVGFDNIIHEPSALSPDGSKIAYADRYDQYKGFDPSYKCFWIWKANMDVLVVKDVRSKKIKEVFKELSNEDDYCGKWRDGGINDIFWIDEDKLLFMGGWELYLFDFGSSKSKSLFRFEMEPSKISAVKVPHVFFTDGTVVDIESKKILSDSENKSLVTD